MYKNNNPIQDESQDVLGRSKSAKDLAKYIRTKFEEFEKYKKDHKDQSLTSHNIAVIGEWGEGKTSFINLLKRQLEEPKAKNWFHKCLNKTRKFFKTAKCSGSLSKTPWLAFIGNNWLKLNDSINSLWLDLIDAENILAHFI